MHSLRLTPTTGVELIGELPTGCVFVAGAYLCSSGSLHLAFTHTANKCVPEDGNCLIPSLGYIYGQCEEEQCSTGPEATAPSVLNERFQVQLVVTSSANALAPAFQFHCRQNVNCYMVNDSLTDTGCLVTKLEDRTEFAESIRDLSSGCNQVVLENGL